MTKYDSDKCEAFIGDYLPIIAPLRDEPITLLELGVFRGGSLKYWADYFTHPQSKIIGIDLVLPDTDFPSNVLVYQCDQKDVDKLEQIAEEHGPFQIVIDDASHQRKETETSFRTLLRHVSVSGHYIIEDWAVGYWRHQPNYAGMVELITSIIERVPDLQIDAMNIVLTPGKAIAFFRKGVTGWS